MKIAILIICALYPIFCFANNASTLLNGDFESGAMTPWNVSTGEARIVSDYAAEGNNCLFVASSGIVNQRLNLSPNTRYRISAMLRCGSGAEDVQMRLKLNNYVVTSVASPVVDWVKKSIEFQTPAKRQNYTLEFAKPFSEAGAGGWIDNVIVERIGDAEKEIRRGIPELPKRTPLSDKGITQQPNEAVRWFLDAKLGMFIHWGLYAGMAKGEWGMQNLAVPIDEYEKLAYPESGDKYFSAENFNADEWANLAKDAGMKYMCLVTQHHDGYALFDTGFPSSFNSMATHQRDFVREYTDACRKAGLKVGLYKTLINWRYPGYYDVNGEDCAPNKWNYTTAKWHKDNATEMKNELYCLTKKLLSDYGKIDLIFWDGGWLAERGSDADGAYFWEPSDFLSSDNHWPVNNKYTLTDNQTGKSLGLMGMVRRLQPEVLCNSRSGWMGDFDNEEGGGKISGPVRNETVIEKCMSLHGAWGYTPAAEDSAKIVKLPDLKRMLADCLIRNMVLELNVGPDRTGKITEAEANLLKELGKWVKSIDEAVYETHGGPWDPEDGQFGFSYKDDTIYVYLLDGYKETEFLFPAIDTHSVMEIYDVPTGKPLKWRTAANGETVVSGFAETAEPVKVFAVKLDNSVY